ncbi:MAG: flagellar biosynthetic protein FliR [Acidobacteria bacterium]|nr:flagellar biosynthetic protein FliR [Acidobacteriota bacterium]
MPDSVAIVLPGALPGLWSFLAVLSRVTATFSFVPLPGFRNQADVAKVVLSLSVTVALYPVWPVVPAGQPSIITLLAWLAADAALGVAVGLAVALLVEGFVLAAQFVGLQAGYSYASTIDPTSQSDSGVLQIAVQLSTSLLFFSLGFHHHVLRAIAVSLEAFPPGTFVISLQGAEAVIRLGSGMFLLAARLAMPVVALLLLVDVTLALLGKLNSHLQLLMLSFPVKMLLGLMILGSILSLGPLLFEQEGRRTLAALGQILRKP